MKRHRRDAFTIRLSLPADKGGSIGSADDDERIEHGIIEQRSSSSHAKAVRHHVIGREMAPRAGVLVWFPAESL